MPAPSLARALAALLALGACTRPAPSTDSAAAVPAPPAAATSVASPDTAPPATDTASPPAIAPAPARRDSAPPSRMVPRPPHPVPLPMLGHGRDAPAIQPAGAGDQASDRASDQAMLDQLRREARDLAHVAGCASAGACAVQPIGERACGGPSEYLVYCPKSTDVAALKRKAAEIARADKAFNAKYQTMSTCEARLAPAAQLVGGQCKAAPAGPAAPGPSEPR